MLREGPICLTAQVLQPADLYECKYALGLYIIPEASTDLQDFYNVVDVYLHGVLHAAWYDVGMRFTQEGWHYELGSWDVSGQIKRDRHADDCFLYHYLCIVKWLMHNLSSDVLHLVGLVCQIQKGFLM